MEFVMRNRVRDYIVLLAVAAALTLPNLGAPSLWDMDEGVNAQAAREMWDAGTWIIPTFNYQLRTAKPALLYWLQQASYKAFGVSEWSARLPSVLAAWLTVLLVYELTLRMFGASSSATALLAGIVLASVLHFGMLAHAATPDATLLLFTVLAFFAFWVGHAGESRRWFIPMAAACGLAMLTKGPVGLLLPGFVVFVYFAWNRELSRLLDHRLLLAGLVFVLVAGPWYALVASETRGEWVKTFLTTENAGRFLNVMDGHDGGMWFYPVAVLVFFVPWSAFVGASVWYGVRGTQLEGSPIPQEVRARRLFVCSIVALLAFCAGLMFFVPWAVFIVIAVWGVVRGIQKNTSPVPEEVRAYRFLVCWIAAYLVFFSAAATKLPNYIFPLYPALAILTARFLVLWRDEKLAVPRWLLPAGIGALALIGIAFCTGMLFAEHTFPGTRDWAVVGLVPVAGALGMAWCLRRGHRSGLVAAAVVASVVFLGTALAFPPEVVDRQKAPRELVAKTGIGDATRDLRVAAFEWFEPSVVFYAGREVQELEKPEAVIEFLAVPTPGYLFVPEQVWDKLEPLVRGPHRKIARNYDFLRECVVLVITNEPGK
jgi:4-amino-4-deoxy-L-arabinose transferase-like glycosyltransferase